jgi:hypothetical protein
MSPDVIAPPRKVRVRTSEGWVDLATQGPEGPGYETSPIGSVIAWTRRELPHGYVLADGATYDAQTWPQGFDAALEEAEAGNPLWTANAGAGTFTVPDLRDRFMYASSSAALGARGGASSVALSANQSGVNGNGASGWADRDHSHGLWLRTYDDGAHAHWVNGTWSHPSGGSYTPRYTDRSGGAYEGGWVVGMHDYYNIWNSNVTDGTPAHSHHIGGDTGGHSTNHLHGLQARNADEAHENMPPYVVLAYVVKLAGAVIGPDGIPAGPPGEQGPPGNSITIPIEPWHIVGEAGEPTLANGWANQGGSENAVAAFRKFPDGRVMLRGLLTAGTSGAPIFTLPPGYRPPSRQRWMVALGGASNPSQHIDVLPDGQVIQFAVYGGQTDLAVIQFDTESVSEWATGPQGPPGPIGAITMESWRYVGQPGEPAFESGWTNYGGFSPASFRKFPDGRVLVRGLVMGGTPTGAVFTLPPGYRPPGSLIFAQSMNPNQWVRLNVSVNGSIGFEGPALSSGWGSIVCEFDTESVTTWPTGPQGERGPPGYGAGIAVQRKFATANAHLPMSAAGVITDGPGGALMQIEVTPDVPSWWEVNGHMGYVQKTDAAYGYVYGGVLLSPADEDNQTQALHLLTQHSTVNQFDHRAATRIWRLAAGTRYVASLQLLSMQGTWSVYAGNSQLWIEGKLWPQ